LLVELTPGNSFANEIVMRLDLFLKASRLCPRRTVAQQLCEAGLVVVNGSPAKPAHPIKPGDEISIKRKDKLTRLRVLVVPSERQTAKNEAGMLYEVVNEQNVADDLLA
jgi:ribosomal 50S subunit-recycling heat shock protein